MSTEVEELQVNELNDVKVLVDEDKVQEKSTNTSARFAQLLEYFWKQDEEAAESADSAI